MDPEVTPAFNIGEAVPTKKRRREKKKSYVPDVRYAQYFELDKASINTNTLAQTIAKGCKAAFDASSKSQSDIEQALAICIMILNGVETDAFKLAFETWPAAMYQEPKKAATEEDPEEAVTEDDSLKRIMLTGIDASIKAYGGTALGSYGNLLAGCKPVFEDMRAELNAQSAALTDEEGDYAVEAGFADDDFVPDDESEAKQGKMSKRKT